MRAITVHQPWADLIVTGRKRVENRSRPTHHRGQLAIHAGLSRRQCGPGDDERTFGALLGVVEVYDCLSVAEYRRRFPGDQYATGPWCWCLRGARALSAPVPCRGSQGFFNVDLDT